MKLLLDTHIWLWSRGDLTRLSKRVCDALASANNEIWVSPVSIWEIFLLIDGGRLALDPRPEDWVRRGLSAPVKEAPLTSEVLLAGRELRLPHRDPADLFIAATARAYDLTLVTGDSRLLGIEGISTLSNL